MAKKARKKASSKKVVRKKLVRKKKAMPKKTTRKKTTRKAIPAKTKTTVSSRDKTSLKAVLKQTLVLIAKINKKEKAIRDEIDRTQKKIFSTKDSTKKMQHSFKLEELKIDAYTHVEKEYKELSPLLNKAYKYADRIGGLVRDDFLDICQSLSKGINMIAMEKDIKKMYKDI